MDTISNYLDPCIQLVARVAGPPEAVVLPIYVETCRFIRGESVDKLLLQALSRRPLGYCRGLTIRIGFWGFFIIIRV